MFKEILGDAFPLIEKFAPAIATAVATPTAGLATAVGMHLLGVAFGIQPGNADALKDAIMHNPEQLGSLNEKFVKYFQFVRMPAEAELNIKLKWANQDNQG